MACRRRRWSPRLTVSSRPGATDQPLEPLRLLHALIGGEGQVHDGVRRVRIEQRTVSTLALIRVAPVAKYHCVDPVVAHGVADAGRWRRLICWSTATAPASMSTMAPIHGAPCRTSSGPSCGRPGLTETGTRTDDPWLGTRVTTAGRGCRPALAITTAPGAAPRSCSRAGGRPWPPRRTTTRTAPGPGRPPAPAAPTRPPRSAPKRRRPIDQAADDQGRRQGGEDPAPMRAARAGRLRDGPPWTPEPSDIDPHLVALEVVGARAPPEAPPRRRPARLDGRGRRGEPLGADGLASAGAPPVAGADRRQPPRRRPATGRSGRTDRRASPGRRVQCQPRRDARRRLGPGSSWPNRMPAGGRPTPSPGAGAIRCRGSPRRRPWPPAGQRAAGRAAWPPVRSVSCSSRGPRPGAAAGDGDRGRGQDHAGRGPGRILVHGVVRIGVDQLQVGLEGQAGQQGRRRGDRRRRPSPRGRCGWARRCSGPPAGARRWPTLVVNRSCTSRRSAASDRQWLPGGQ